VGQIRRFREFCAEVWAELKRTSWPARSEVYGTTLVVIVTVLICACFLWIVDLILVKGMDTVFRATGQ